MDQEQEDTYKHTARLKDWFFLGKPDSYRILGTCTDESKQIYDSEILTGKVIKFDPKNLIAETVNTIYSLYQMSEAFTKVLQETSRTLGDYSKLDK